ncbi:hypothetical protein NDU88_003050 [Pleurodeles waltl]|uniref:Reverse transcriptase domain-containing protein n=1 Tax=Pleurodeles waltl TaxID=8319 RepID=A0AAV7VEP5_PLEWA|nr:hypothetical protein NDU88_003050 [Pleurodeles waltl]
MSQLTLTQADELDRLIHTEEVTSGTARMKPHKSPGLDGIPASFYKIFLHSLAPILTRVFKFIDNPHNLFPSLREASIVVISKLGKDKQKVESYWMISLLSVDVKLLTGILAAQLNPQMADLVIPDQAGFVLLRECCDITKIILHIIAKAKSSKREILLLPVDAEKTFNHLHWPYLTAMLTHFAFGFWFHNWILSNYGHPRATVRVNGHTSTFFTINMGTPQGCLLSYLLFALYVEPFAEKVSEHPNITVVRFGGKEHIICLYADDIIALDNLRTALLAFLEEVGYFSEAEALQIDIQTSQPLNLLVSPHMAAQISSNFPIQ